MKTCDWTLQRLDDFVDGVLPESEVPELESHLSTCDACREDLNALQSLLHDAAALPSAMQPGRDLWTGIAPRLGRGRMVDWRRHGRTALFAAAVAAMAVVAVSVGLARAPRALPEAPAFAEPERASYDRVIARDRSALREVYLARADDLDPDLRSVIDSNLTIIDESLDELRRAMEMAPDNMRLEKMYIAARQTELQVLRLAVQHGSEG